MTPVRIPRLPGHTPWMELAPRWADQYPTSAKAKLRLAHDGGGIVAEWRIEDDGIRGVEDDGGRTWEDSCAEIFIETEPGKGYYNIECTCRGKLLMAFGTGRHGRAALDSATVASVKRMTNLDGGEIPVSGNPTEWTLLMKIPAAAIGMDSLGGKAVRMNAYKCGDKLPRPHFLSLAPTGTETPDYHRPESFIAAEFEP